MSTADSPSSTASNDLGIELKSVVCCANTTNELRSSLAANERTIGGDLPRRRQAPSVYARDLYSPTSEVEDTAVLVVGHVHRPGSTFTSIC
jgi:hypothetical protein